MSGIYLEKALGIDFREDCVSLVLMGRLWKKAEILAVHHFRSPPLTPGNAEIENLVIDEIQRFIKQHSVGGARVAVGIPRDKAGLHFLELPAPKKEMVGSMIGFELERHLPSSPEEFYYTYHAVRSAETHHRLCLESVRRENVDYYVQLLSRANLKPQTVDCSTFAGLSFLIGTEETARGLQVIVDAGARSFEITLLNDGNIIYNHKKSVSNANAANTWHLGQDLPAEHIERAGKVYAGEIIDGIQESLAGCERVPGDQEVARIHLIRGGSMAGVMAQEIGEKSGVTVNRVWPQCGTVPEAASAYDPALMATACGLALRELKPGELETNLLPENLRPRKKRANIRTSLILLAATALTAVTAAGNYYYFNQQRLESLETDLKAIRLQVAPLEKIDQEQDEIKKHVDLLAALQAKNPHKLPLIEQLTQLLPPGTWLTDIIYVKNEIQIKGVSAKASDLISILEQSPVFKNVHFNGAITKTPEGEKFAIQAVPEALP